MKAVYRAYVSARKKCNEPTQNLSFDKIAKALRKQTETKGNVKDFKVVIRGTAATPFTSKGLEASLQTTFRFAAFP